MVKEAKEINIKHDVSINVLTVICLLFEFYPFSCSAFSTKKVRQKILQLLASIPAQCRGTILTCNRVEKRFICYCNLVDFSLNTSSQFLVVADKFSHLSAAQSEHLKHW